jgi:hypothetical protein
MTETELLAELGIDGRIKRGLKEIGWLCVEWNDTAPDRDKREAFVQAAMNNHVSYDAVNFLTG